MNETSINRAEATAFAGASAAGPDAELVVHSQAFVAEVWRQGELWRRAVTVETEDTVERQLATVAAAHAAVLDRLCGLQARTTEGLRAKAQALAAAEPAFLRGRLEGSETGGRILASLLHDLLGCRG